MKALAPKETNTNINSGIDFISPMIRNKMFLKKAVESLFQGISGELSEAERLISELLTTILEGSAVWTRTPCV